MKQAEPLLVIVPDKKGVTALAGLAGISPMLVAPAEAIPAAAQTAGILVVGPAEQQKEVDDALRQIDQLPQLKLLQTLGQGVEQWEGKLPAELKLSTASGAHGGSTAEWVLMSLLALVRDLPAFMANQRAHTWRGHQTNTLLNADVLVYGAGDLGQNVRSRLIPFGAQVTMVGTHSRDGVVDTTTARRLLPHIDAVVMALPLTADTRHIIDADFLALLPEKAIVINAGRGGLVDQGALLKELSSGRLLAALDVATPEPLAPDNPLWDAPGLLLTPHVGGNTAGSDDRAWQIAAEHIRAFMHQDLRP